MKFTAIGLLVGAVIGSLIMVMFDEDTLLAMTSASFVGAMGVATDIVLAKLRSRQSQVHTA